MAAITDKFGKASIDTDYAIATTVKTTRLENDFSVLEAFDLSKFTDDTPVFFVTYKKTTDPVTDVTSVTNLVSWKGLVNAGANTITNLVLAPGYADTGNAIGDFIECIPTSYWVNSMMDGIFVGHNPDGTFKKATLKSALGDDGNLTEVMDSAFNDFVLSGGVWSALAGLNAGMTLLTGYIDGYRNTVAAVATRAFTPSKDTYVDVLRNTTTNAFSLVYTEVANGAASPALAANSMRIAKVVTSGAAVTSVTQFGRDSLSNTIYPNGVVSGAQLDTNELSSNMKLVYNNASVNPSGTSTNNYGNAHGLVTSLVLPKPTSVLVHCSINASSTTDFEFHPIIFLNDVEVKRTSPVAAPGFGGNRSTERSVAYQAILPAGSYTIKGGAYFASGTSISSPAGSCFLWVIAFGKVIG